VSEVQKHGFLFEDWVKANFFQAHISNYGHKWDVLEKYNTKSVLPEKFLNLPVSIKTAKNGSPIGLGDAIRQYDIDTDFLLIVGFWEQVTAQCKYFVSVEAQRINLGHWKSLWHPLKREDLLTLNTTIKDLNLHYSQARIKAQEIKRNYPQIKIILNPKIDSNKQRRLQCSLPFKIFWEELIQKQPYENPEASFLGKKIPNPFKSSSRTFNH